MCVSVNSVGEVKLNSSIRFPVFDSWTKFQAGVTYGNVHDFGNFDQCVEFEHNSSVGLIQGQHCVIYYRAAANASSEHPSADGIFDWREM